MTTNTRHHALGVAMLAAVAIGSALAGNQAHNQHFASLDADGDGAISVSEHAAGAAAMFIAMDADKDGLVTASEMDAMRAGGHVGKHAGKAVSADAGDDERAGSEFSSSEKIAVLDQDGDGKLSRPEHETGARSMFAKSDTNLDGAISASEMAAARESMMQHD